MRFAGSALAILALAALPAACSQPRQDIPRAVRVQADGVGPLRLGADLPATALQAKRLDPAALPVGPGCDGRDEFAMHIDLLGEASSIMAMADAEGRIEELIIQPSAKADLRTTDDHACLRLAEAFADRFSEKLGRYTTGSHTQKASTIEQVLSYPGGQRVQARWFRGGGNCDFALRITRHAG
ncbi:hypothetical protein [Thauera linaloolentis]|uniref:Lipoprotein n=1 Tax=Thauera linaloolentis (strain DSM 12138 / JCM 21573 / CCUG 41526 / CIP 105981 / IAM 15112 / NBRC 102519 / 47Lol) TaxID=1123367 RepID=N6YET5_THAL4|nr:hypothetical protein [Thauera linaloolentis]ENO90035.1 hypothetical protein C666_03190 [Thauera linaloolentis 47Lol = DSM 12138]MCM8565319.1 hypothetical protein [Thauera linaloolentis]